MQKERKKKHHPISQCQLFGVTKIWDTKIFTPSQEPMSTPKLNIQFKNIGVSLLQRPLWPGQDLKVLPFTPPLEVASFTISFTYYPSVPWPDTVSRDHFSVWCTSFIWHFPWGGQQRGGLRGCINNYIILSTSQKHCHIFIALVIFK